eukprot:3795324-Amphidinium_carterae.5
MMPFGCVQGGPRRSVVAISVCALAGQWTLFYAGCMTVMLPLNHEKRAVLPCALGVNAWSTLLRCAAPPQRPLLFVGIGPSRYLGYSTSAVLTYGMHLGVARNVQLGPIMTPIVLEGICSATNDGGCCQPCCAICLALVQLHRNETSLEHVSLVAKLPLLLGAVSDFSTTWRAIIVSRCPHGLLAHPWASWMDTSCWRSWQCARVQFHDVGFLRSDGTFGMALPGASAAIWLACVPSLPQNRLYSRLDAQVLFQQTPKSEDSRDL